MCLVCIAFASWVLRSSDPEAADSWKAGGNEAVHVCVWETDNGMTWYHKVQAKQCS
uniref:Uncharacterized protein n=1 Tax=Gouania willdenowi TaxID=441366 RepID=A0A8C5I0X2_GOUWI